MTRMVSTVVKVKQLEGLIGKEGDLSAWEKDFVESVADRVRGGTPLTDKQLTVVDRIWRKHFA